MQQRLVLLIFLIFLNAADSVHVVCVLDGEGNRTFALTALVAACIDGSVSDRLVIVWPVSMNHFSLPCRCHVGLNSF